MTDFDPSAAKGMAPELTDEDVYDAMSRLPGYLDITTDDFRALYRLAFGHAVDRIVAGLRVRGLMRRDTRALQPQMSLAEAARVMAQDALKSMPVADPQDRVVGMLSETDVLARLGCATFMELLVQAPERFSERERMLDSERVAAIMTSPAVTVTEEAGFRDVQQAFGRHAGRRMPVVDREGRLLGMLVRKDFIAACPFSTAG